jgi:hypothetical protein
LETELKYEQDQEVTGRLSARKTWSLGAHEGAITFTSEPNRPESGPQALGQPESVVMKSLLLGFFLGWCLFPLWAYLEKRSFRRWRDKHIPK